MVTNKLCSNTFSDLPKKSDLPKNLFNFQTVCFPICGHAKEIYINWRYKTFTIQKLQNSHKTEILKFATKTTHYAGPCRDHILHIIFVRPITAFTDKWWTYQSTPVEHAHPVTLVCLQLKRNFRAKGFVASCFRNETTNRVRRHGDTMGRNETVLLL